MTEEKPNPQAVFKFWSDLQGVPAPAAPRPRRQEPPREALSKMDYDMLLTRALHRHTLSHPVYAALVATAHGQFHQPQPYAIAGIAGRLGTSYHTVVWHLRKYPDLFIVDDSSSPFRVTLSAEGQQLLAQIHATLQLYRTQPAAS